MMKRLVGFVLALGLVLTLAPAARAQIFSEDFNGYSGNQNNTQGNTGLPVAHTGTVAGWSRSGAGTMHAVNLGGGDWAIMFWQDNVITLSSGIAANDNGVQYTVDFDYGTADYAGGQGTGAGDSLLVEVLRGDNSVLASNTFAPGAWGAGNYNLDGGLTGSLPYTGDGSGVVRLRIGPSAGSFNQGRFAGEIDNITVALVPPPSSITWSAEATSGIDTNTALASADVDTNLTETVLVWDTSDQGTGSTNDWTFRQSLGPTNAGTVSGQITGLNADTNYTWRLYGKDGTTNGWSAATTFWTALGAAQTPVFTNATGGPGSVTLGWQDNASGETGYVLQRSSTGAGGSYTHVATLASNTVSHADVVPSAGTYHYRLAATNANNGSATLFVNCQTNATAAEPPPVDATGGDSTHTNGNYRIHVYTSTGNSTFNVTQGGSVEVLVVAGGGGGGSRHGGGGGAGGLIHSNAYAVVSGSNYTVTVGAGGAGNPDGGGGWGAGSSGANSVFGDGGSALTAIGGGAGGADGARPGGNGGSGGGSGYDGASQGTGTAGQGNDGGSGTSAWAGRGGGGAGGPGESFVGNDGSAGGPGLNLSISGTPTWYAAGGGGGSWTDDGGSGGSGIGGDGGDSASPVGGPGAAGTGSGGGGGGDAGAGGAGGSGIVIVRYLATTPPPVTLSNNSASDEQYISATFNASLEVPSTNADVYVYWGTTDGTNNPAAWSTNAYVGSWTNVASTNISYPATGLAAGTSYYYTFRATNDATNVWATPSTSFSTLAPSVTMANSSATDKRLLSATFNGTLGTAGNDVDVYVYWGITDGTNNPAAWTNTAYVGSWTNVASTNISFAATGLDHSTSYFYTFRATNSTTNVWASPSTSFSTLNPTVFTENFNGLTGGGAGTQAETGLGLKAGASLTGWTGSGAGTIHAVNLDGGGDWAIMFYQDNVLTLTTGIAANEVGVTYNVEFDYGTAVYAGLTQRTEATDSLLVEVLRGDNSVLASGTFAPGTWANPANANLNAGLHGTLQYVGDGTGVVRLRLGPTPPYNSGNFEGEIDNVSVTIYEATQLAFTTQPGNGTAGGALTAQPVVELQDVLGNVVTTETSTVTLAIGNDAGPGAVLSGTLSQAAVAGEADFGTNALSIDKEGTGYTLVATAGSLASATSAVFDVTSGVGAPAKLAFTTQPGGGANHVVWGTQPAVELQDASGIAVTGVETNVTVSILNDAGPGATLSGTQTIAVDTNTGVATFTDLSIDLVGSGYTLQAAASGLTSATSAVFNITVGPAAQLAFTTQPTNGYTASAFLQLPAVTLQDAYGYTVVGTAQNVTLAIQNNAGPGATLSGTTTVAVDTSSGQAIFDGLSIDKVGTGYNLTATGNTVQTTPGVVVSSAFDIQAGTAWSLANDFTLATNDNASTWSFRLGSSAADPKPTQLLTTNTRNANQLWNTDFGTPPTMWSDASSYYGIGKNTTGTTQTRSLGPNVTWAPNEVLLWPNASGSPGRLVISWLAPFSTTVDIDYSWGTATGSGNGVGIRVWHESTVLADWYNPYPNPSTGTVSALEVAAGDRFYFEYDPWANQPDDATRAAITITTLPATQLAFSTQPGNGTAGSPLAVQPAVELQDVNGHKVTKEASTVTLAIGTDAGPGAVLSGTLSQDAAAGTADFSTNALSIDKEGVGYTLVATAGSLTSATSAVFNVNAGVGAPAKLQFTTQPGGGPNNVAWSTQPQVTLQDASGLTVTGVATNITVAIQNNAAGDGVLNGTATVAVNTGTGIATFSGLNIDKPGEGYTLVASCGSLTTDVSDPFDITVGPAAQLAFTTQPGDGFATIPFATQSAVILQDAFGYTVTGTAQNVTLAIQNNAGPGGTLSGTKTVAVNTGTGIATFSGLSIDIVGTGYTLTATGNTVSTTPGVVVSSGFNITANPYVFFEDFNGYSSGNAPGTQSDTGLGLNYGGNLADWSKSGAGVIHAVDLDGGGNWAIMFFQDNVITLSSGIAANEANRIYTIEFDYGTAVYAGLSQQTEATDSLLVEVLRGDNSVLASATFAAGTWGAGNYNLDAGLQGSFDYTGDGTGAVRLRLGPTPPYNSGNFEGEVDNLTVTRGATTATLFKLR